ncbi:hypothetical protein G7054_g3833 [Neopestalotiopsis clavispora]|nr:hypothetical protein G7054_g3833 [Neopestalotiopsis clavispora]
MGSIVDIQHAESARTPAPAHRWSLQIISYSIIVNIGMTMGRLLRTAWCFPPYDVENRRVAFLFAKMIIGVVCGMLLCTCQTYISEITPPNVHGIVLGFYALNVSLGHLLVTAIVFTQAANQNMSSYQVPFATQWAFAGLSIIAATTVPESLVWLLARDREVEAEKTIKHLEYPDDQAVRHGMRATLLHEQFLEARESGNPTYRENLQGTNLRRTRNIITLNLIEQFVGIAIVSNGVYFLTMAGMNSHDSLMVNLIGIASNVVANMASWYTVSRFGRLAMTLISIGLDFVAWVSMGIAGYSSTPAAKWYVGIALLLFGFFNSLGVASAVPVISSEISSVRLRSKSQGIGLTVQCLGAWVFSFFTPYLYNVDQANWGGKIGFFFAGLSTIAFAVTWLDVPETIGRTFAELDVLFEDKVPARKFKYTQVASPEAEPTDGAKTGAQMFQHDDSQPSDRKISI